MTGRDRPFRSSRSGIVNRNNAMRRRYTAKSWAIGRLSGVFTKIIAKCARRLDPSSAEYISPSQDDGIYVDVFCGLDASIFRV